jgi:hypothetical protein
MGLVDVERVLQALVFDRTVVANQLGISLAIRSFLTTFRRVRRIEQIRVWSFARSETLPLLCILLHSHPPVV